MAKQNANEEAATRRVVVLLDVPAENALTDVENDLRHYFAGVVSVAEASSSTSVGDSASPSPYGESR